MTDTNPAPDRRELLRQALTAIDDLQARLDRAQQAAREPIAVVGMSCRFPGAPSLDAFWQLLSEGGDAVSTYPADRVALVARSGVDFDALGGDPSEWSAGFLDHIDEFDPQFFGIAPREAASMDPQQRLLLEVSWEALEHAGIAPDSLAGSSTGVFVGITTNDYVQLGKLGGAGVLDVYAATGGALNAAAGRVAYTLGLQGPAMAIDTACSSSLVAVHQACQSLRSGDSTMAIAAGVNLLLLPEAFVCFEQWGMMAPDGRCKTFDASADGFVRGEGCGVVVLKLLRDAVAAGDRVLAVIRGSAVNQDGASSGLTVPNGPAQQAVLRRAYDVAGVSPGDVQYVEAHGTGTTLGDPIEVEALGAVLRRGRRPDAPLVLGSVKTNIGHLESAAGIAGLIKVVLAMRHGEIPPHRNFRERNPEIPWPAFPVVVPTSSLPWPGVDGRRVAGVSAFGFSGTNAHVVLESAPATPEAAHGDADVLPELVVLSGRGHGVVRQEAARLAAALDDAASLADVSSTAGTGRAHLTHRAAFVADSVAALRAQLERFAAGDETAARAARAGRAGRPTVGFVFSGQGSQRVGMGRELYAAERVFRDALDRCAGEVARWWEPSAPGLVDVLWGERGGAGVLDRTEFTQPALFALEWSLAELWASWGVRPRAVLGHSVGGIVAAAVAGVFSVDDGVRLAVERGRLMGGLPAGGVMVAVFGPVDAIEAVLADLPDDLRAQAGVAAVNGAAHTVVSGAADAVERVVAMVEALGLRTSRLVVSHAFHSPLMVPVAARIGHVVAQLALSVPSTCQVVSDVSGLPVTTELTDPAYWAREVVEPVRFADGVASLRALGVDVFVEIGPHPVLTGMVSADGVGDGEVWVGSMRRGRGERAQVLDALGAVHVSGARVDLAALATRGGDAAPARRVDLPSYPFQRQPHWFAPVAKGPRRRNDAGAHPLLGTRTEVPSLRASVFESEVRADAPAWLADHRLSGTIVFPGSAYLELLLAASDRAVEMVDRVSIQEALVLAEDEVVSLQTVVSDRPGGREVEVVSTRQAPGDGSAGWTVHARATLRRREAATAVPLDVDAVDRDFPDEVDVDEYYGMLRNIGLTYGPAFRGLTRLRRRDGAAAGLAALHPSVTDGSRLHLHPALLDACFHVLGVAVAPLGEHASDDMLVPVAVDGLHLHRSGVTTVWCVVTVLDDGDGGPTITARVELHDLDGSVVATIDRLEVRRTPRSLWQRAAAARQPLYEVVWRPQARPEPAAAEGGPAVVIVDGSGAGARLADVLAPGRRGIVCDPADVTDLPSVLAAVGGAATVDVVLLAPAGATGAVAADLEPTITAALGAARSLAALPPGRSRLWLVTRGGQSIDGEPADVAHGALWGLGRVLANEQPQLGCRLVDLDPSERADAVEELAAELVAADADTLPEQVALRGRRRLVGRLVRTRPDQHATREGPYRLTFAERGSLEALTLVPAVRAAPGEGEVEVEVRCSGLNFRDVLNVLGMYPGDPGPPGLEMAGVVAAVGPGVADLAVGDRVMGIAPQAFDSHVVTRAGLVVRVPDILTFAEAATVPIAFLTADYGLRRLAGLRAGERVLIHAAAGGVGQAAVQLAQQVGAEVFATVGSADKRRHLESLGVRHIYGSRTLDFAERVLADTGGRGVEVVLNSLSDDFVDRSFQVLAPGGRFLEIGKRGVWSSAEAAERRPDASYHLYDLADFLLGDPASLRTDLQRLADELTVGELAPLPVRAFPAESVEAAFRFMAQARHIGKVVVRHRACAPVVRPDGGYVVTGGLGGLGLAVASWLTERRAASIVLVGRHAPTPDAAATVDRLAATGVDVRVVAADVSTNEGVDAVMAEVRASGVPLRGVVHAAGVVDDGAATEQTWARCRDVLAPKIDGAVRLDRATRHLDLDHVVLFSSASALLGPPGQSTYAAANAALDAFAHQRRSAGSPTLSIDWGAWADVGMAAALGDRELAHLTSRGTTMMSPTAALETFGSLLSTSAAQAAVLAVDWSVLLAGFPPGGVPPLLTELGAGSESSGSAGAATVDVRAEIAAAEEDGRAVLDAFVRDQVERVLGLDPGEPLDPVQGLTDLGMDSLMAVELSNRLRGGLALPLPSTVAFEHPTFRALTDHLASLVLPDPGRGAPMPTAPVRRDAGMEAVAALSDEEAADRLLRELEESGY